MSVRLARIRSADGFTLIEGLVAMVLMGILLTAMTRILVGTSQFGDQTQQAAVHQSEVRGVLDRMVADIRQATEGDGTSPIQSVSGTQITFDSPDRAAPFHLRRISYRVASGELDMTSATSSNTSGPPWTLPAQGPWTKQIGAVVNTTPFAFLDSSGAPTTDPTQVRVVTITIVVQNGNQTAAFRTSASVRASQ